MQAYLIISAKPLCHSSAGMVRGRVVIEEDKLRLADNAQQVFLFTMTYPVLAANGGIHLR